MTSVKPAGGGCGSVRAMLRSFVIQGFRTFEHLSLTELGAVNLVTGRNNVGKTMLLEALRLFAAEGDARIVEAQLRARDEFDVQREPARLGHAPAVDITALFHGRPTLNGTPLSLTLGPADAARGRPDAPRRDHTLVARRGEQLLSRVDRGRSPRRARRRARGSLGRRAREGEPDH